VNTAPKTKRQQLGELIGFQRTEQGMSKHNLADKTRTTTNIVERWEGGTLVPTLQEWQRMRDVFPPLKAGGGTGGRYRELFDAAAAEQLAIETAKESPRPAAGSGDLDAAVRILVDAVPHLRSLSIEIDDDGGVAVSYLTREVRIVEDKGSLQMRVR
jgi:hypothetical protein